MIIGVAGFQRSGKTSLSVYIARLFQKAGCDIYSNMEAPGFHLIEKISEIPFDKKSKVLLLDEIYSFFDSRNSKANTEASIFFNTLGKSKVCLIYTTIAPHMVDKRLREQTSYMIFAKDGGLTTEYLVVDVLRCTLGRMSLERTTQFFSSLNYDSNLVIPNLVEFDATTWKNIYYQQKKLCV